MGALGRRDSSRGARMSMPDPHATITTPDVPEASGRKTTSWRPANGSEGRWFEYRYCDRCVVEPGACMIQSAAWFFDIDDPEYPTEWIEEDGTPRCTAFEEAK